MKKICALMLLLAIAPGVRAVDETEDLAQLFPFRAEISSGPPGLCRVELSPEIIAACRPDLADLRILGGDGREIPYIVDSPEPEGTAIAVQFRADLEVLDARRAQHMLDDRTTTFFESFDLRLPTRPAEVQGWQLELTTGTTEFVSRIHVMAVDRERQARTIFRGSAFRMPAAGAEKVQFTLSEPGAERLRVELETQNTGYLQPRFAVEASRILPLEATSRLSLPIRSSRSHVDTTEIVVDRPRGLVPRRLAITTTTDTFRRRITVWDEGPGASPEALGVGEVLRIAAIAPVAVLELPIRPPRGDRLRLVIENHDSPPLAEPGVEAVMPRPVLVLSRPSGTPGPMVYFGGGRARRPHYDLAALDPDGRLPVSGEDADRALAVLDPARAQPASIGPAEENPGYDPAPVLAFAMHPGAAIDTRMFSKRRRVDILPSAEGLSRIPLEPSDLAALRPDLADLRLVDADDRQWAYLRQHDARVVYSDLQITGRESKNRMSRYEIEILEGALEIDRIEIQTEASFFDRDFRLRGRLENGEEKQLAHGRLVRRIGDPRPPAMRVDPARVTALELVVEDGDDAPLEITGLEARSSAPDVYTAAVAGPYLLLLGHPDAETPVYELERIRSTILAVPAGDAFLGELEANPDFSAASRISRSGGLQQFLLWGALGIAVIVLVAVTLRAARQEGPGSN